MKIEAVVICSNYSDFLEVTLPINKSYFDRMLVVSTPDDVETRRLCDFYHVECFQTDAFFLKDAPFNKGNAVEAALGHMDWQDWCVHLDADIVLPSKTGQILHSLKLNEQCLYGIDRMMCPDRDSWDEYMRLKLPQHELAYVHPGPFLLGTRIAKLECGGYIPIGFFQMFHRSASVLQKRPWYPTEYPDASASDEMFALKWDRAHRHMLPELIAIHLEMPPEDDGSRKEMGTNWKGRKTGKFISRKTSPFGNYVRVTPKV